MSMSPVSVATEIPAKLRHNTDFKLNWLAVVCSTGSFQMLGVIVGWQVYELTHSTLMLGLVGLAQYLPVVLLALPSGHVADTSDRRNVVRLCEAVAGCGVLGLALLNGLGQMHVAAIFAVVALVAAMRAFERPALTAQLPNLVGNALLPRALALNASATQVATIAGPALGGVLYIFGPAVAYTVVGACYVTASILVTCIKMRHVAGKRSPMSLASMLSGFKFIWKHEMVLGAISLDMCAVLLGGATALLPVFAHDILHVGPAGLGVLRATPALGALLTALWLARHPIRRHVGLKMFAAVAVFGVATILFGLSTSFLLSLFALCVMGVADVVSVVIRGMLVQLNTPDNMRGRVSSVNFMFVGTSNQLGEFESGATAALLGTVPAVVFGGIGTLAVVGAWMLMFPGMRKADQLKAKE